MSKRRRAPSLSQDAEQAPAPVAPAPAAGLAGPWSVQARFGNAHMVQRAQAGAAQGDVLETAAAGVAGSGGPMPFGERIQAAFGDHDVSGARAHVGGEAGQAASDIGALAFAMGSDVAFAGAPDLHTAAHEAAHVIQQRQGVQLKGGVGEAGDPYERHADQVADAVVAGRSAEGLLDGMAGGGGGPSVQCEADTSQEAVYRRNAENRYRALYDMYKRNDPRRTPEQCKRLAINVLKADMQGAFPKNWTPPVMETSAPSGTANAGQEIDPQTAVAETAECLASQPLEMTEEGAMDACIEQFERRHGTTAPLEKGLDQAIAEDELMSTSPETDAAFEEHQRRMADPNNVTFDFGGRLEIIPRAEWPAFYAKNIEPMLKKAEAKADSVAGMCRHLDADNEDYWPISTIVNFMGGTSTNRPNQIANLLQAQIRLPLHDARVFSASGMAEQCIANMHEAVQLANAGDVALGQYYDAIGRGADHTITAIKVTAAVATAAVTGGASLSVSGTMMVGAAGAVGSEGMELYLKALDPGQQVTWADGKKALINVVAKTAGAGLGAKLGPAIASGSGGAISAAVADRFISSASEEVLKAMLETSNSRDEFYKKLEVAIQKGIAEGYGPGASELVPDARK